MTWRRRRRSAPGVAFRRAPLRPGPHGTRRLLQRRVAKHGQQVAEGQTMVELALFIPVLLLIAMVVVDFGRALGTAISASNAAKQASFLVSQAETTYTNGAYALALPCMQDQVGTLVGNEVSGTLSLATTSPSTQVMTGEFGIRATVAVSFTPVTPIIRTFLNPLLISQAAAEDVIPSPVYTASVAPALPLTPTVHQMQDPTVTTTVHLVDQLTWAISATALASTTSYYNNDGTGPYTATGFFEIYRNPLPHVGSPASLCPFDHVSMAQGTPTITQTYLFSATEDVPTTPTVAAGDVYSPTYWIQAVGPAPPGYTGAASTTVSVSRY